LLCEPAAQFHAIGPKSNRNRSSNLARMFPSIFRAESLPAWINWGFTTYEPQTVRTTCWDDLLVSNASPGRTDEAAGAIEISTRIVLRDLGSQGVEKTRGDEVVLVDRSTLEDR
jgi:hypothetical protein